MPPEISRRCLACGASVRAGARFCPQCGHNLGDEEEPVGAGPSAAAETHSGEAAAAARGDGGDGAAKDAGAVGPADTAPPWAAPAPTAASEEHIGLRTTREEAAGLRTTRDVETRGGGATPATRETSAAAGEGAAPTAPPTRETSVAPEAAAPRPAPATRETSATRDMAAPRGTLAASRETQAAMRGTQAEPAGAAEAEPAADGAGAEASGRSRRAAARVKETVMPRVEKMRDEALVVIEETPDDSGLRFVIIAVFLFGLFLLFLLLSTTVLR